MYSVEKDFMMIAGFKPLHPTNRVCDFNLRKDIIFSCLAEKIFDNPRLLHVLMKKMKYWLVSEKSELTYAMAGYLYYIKEDFKGAERYFLKAINENKENLDNWFDLAFSLYHQLDKKHNLGKMILFNFDFCVENFKNKKVNLKELEKALRNRLFSFAEDF
ncbi:MAG: hypothetical protein NC923_07295 [Candidatus Omnitrophica bacterium]|nr:hypothetical protein [Candidatus Omnitrophota bacterium]